MEFTLKEKLMLATKYRKYAKNSDYAYKFNGDSLVVLPDNDIAFKMAELFIETAQGKVHYLLKLKVKHLSNFCKVINLIMIY